MSREQAAHLIRLYIQLLSVCRPEPTTDGNVEHLGSHRCLPPCWSEDGKQSYGFTDLSDEWFTIDPF